MKLNLYEHNHVHGLAGCPAQSWHSVNDSSSDGNEGDGDDTSGFCGPRSISHSHDTMQPLIASHGM